MPRIHRYAEMRCLLARGNKARAAKALGINRRSMYRLLEKYGIHSPDSTDEPAPAPAPIETEAQCRVQAASIESCQPVKLARANLKKRLSGKRRGLARRSWGTRI